MAKDSVSGPVGNGFVPPEFHYGQGNDSAAPGNKAVKVQARAFPRRSRKRPYPFSQFSASSKSIQRCVRPVNPVPKNYINGQVKAELLEYVKTALANGRDINIDGSVLRKQNKQLSAVVSEIKNSNDLSSTGKDYQKKFEKVNANEPCEVVEVVVTLIDELDRLETKAGWVDDQTAKRFRELDTKLKEILKHFYPDFDEGYSSDSTMIYDFGRRSKPDVSVADPIGIEPRDDGYDSDDEIPAAPQKSVGFTQTQDTQLEDAFTEIEVGDLPDTNRVFATQTSGIELEDASTTIENGELPDPQREELNKLRDEIREASDRTTLEGTSEKLRHRVELQQSAVVEARDQQRQAEQNLAATEQKLATAEQHSEELAAEKGRLQEVVTETGSKLRKAQDELAAEELKNQELRDRNGELQSAVVAARDQQRQAEQNLASTEQKLATAKQHSEVLVAEKGRLQEVVTETGSKLRKAQDELAAEELKNQELRDRNGELQSAVVKASDQQRQIEQRLKRLQSDLSATQVELDRSRKSEDEIKREVEKEKGVVDGLRQEVKEKNSNLKDLKAKLSDVSLQKSGLENRLHKAGNDKVVLENQLSQTLKKAGHLEHNNIDLRAALKEQRDVIESQNKELTELSDLKEKLKETSVKIAGLEKEKEANNVISENRMENIEKLKGEINALKERNYDLANSLNASEGREEQSLDKELKAKAELMGVQANALSGAHKSEVEIDKLKKLNNKLKSQLDGKFQEINGLNADKLDRDSKIRSLQYQIDESEKSKGELTDQLRTVKDELDELNAKYNQQSRNITQRDGQHTQALEEIKKQNQDFSDELDKVLDQNSRLLKEKKEVEYEYGRKEKELEAQVSELEEMLEQQRAMLDEHEMTNKKSQEELAVLRKDNEIFNKGVAGIIQHKHRMLPKIPSPRNESDFSSPNNETVMEWDSFSETLSGVDDDWFIDDYDLKMLPDDQFQALGNIKRLEKSINDQVGEKEKIIKDQQALLEEKNAQNQQMSDELARLKREMADLKKNNENLDDLKKELKDSKSELTLVKNSVKGLKGGSDIDAFNYLLEHMKAAVKESQQLLAEHEAKLQAFVFDVQHVNNGEFFNEEAERVLGLLKKELKALDKQRKKYVASAESVAKKAKEGGHSGQLMEVREDSLDADSHVGLSKAEMAEPSTDMIHDPQEGNRPKKDKE